MVSIATSHTNRRGRAGFTLAEYMVATSIGLLALSAALVLWAYGTRTCAALLGYLELSSVSENALDLMSQQIRNATSVKSCASDALVLAIPSPTGPGTDTVTFAYEADKQAVTRTTVTASNAKEKKTLLTGCRSFKFLVYQRTPQTKSFELYPTGYTTNTAKVVEMQWSCFRKLTGDKNVIEDDTSAKIVMRNP
jgi:hypothetical protein